MSEKKREIARMGTVVENYMKHGNFQSKKECSRLTAEKEREGRSCEEGRIRLAVSGNAVRIHEFLESICIFIGSEMCWRSGPALWNFLHHGL